MTVPPRLSTLRHGSGTYGPLVVDWARRHLDLEFYPWQQEYLAGLLEHDHTGAFHHRWSLLSCGRQNGKSATIAALIGWWLTEGAGIRGEPQSVLNCAHRGGTAIAEEPFHVLLPVFDSGAFGEFRSWSTAGRKELRLASGSKWRIVSATESAGHGSSNDLVVVDELWRVDSDVLHSGLLPTQRARQSPLCAMYSTAGTQASSALLRWREAGLDQIRTGAPGRLQFLEWSAPPGSDPLDPAIWPLANPSWNLGPISEQVILDELQSPDRDQFLRASLNMWTSAVGAWIPPGSWEKLAAPEAEDWAPSVLAVEHAPDGSRFAGLLAGQLADGRTRVRTAFYVSSEVEMWEQIREHLPAGGQLLIPGSLELHCPPDLARRMSTVGTGEIVKYTAIIREMILSGRVCHDGDEQLAEHVTRAVGYHTRAGMGISGQKSPGPIELCRCLIWSVATSSRPKAAGRPAVARPRRRSL